MVNHRRSDHAADPAGERKDSRSTPPEPPPSAAEGKDLRYIFVSPPKFLVGTTVPESFYFRLLDYPGGISQFYEDAIRKFDGDLEALLKASAAFNQFRRQSRPTTPIRSANGRVSQETHDRVLAIEHDLKHVRGISRAKVLAGLIQLAFGTPAH